MKHYFDDLVPMEGDATQKDNCAVAVASLGAIHLKSRPRQDSGSLEESSWAERISRNMSKSSSAEALRQKMKQIAYDR